MPTPDRRRYRDRVVILTVAAALALNYPLLALADRVRLPFGVPLLFLYLYLVWLLTIGAMAYSDWRLERNRRHTERSASREREP